jgi:large conductance mechanosensitive channel protein
MAIGIVIGAAFGAIVSSMVGDIIMPVVGAVTGGLDFSDYFFPLSGKITAITLDAAKKQGAVLAWGHFVTVTLNFIIIAFVLFLVIRAHDPADGQGGRQGKGGGTATSEQARSVAYRDPRFAQEIEVPILACFLNM